jgi:hypothetical protein
LGATIPLRIAAPVLFTARKRTIRAAGFLCADHVYCAGAQKHQQARFGKTKNASLAVLFAFM